MKPTRREIVMAGLTAIWVIAMWLWLYFGPLNQ